MTDQTYEARASQMGWVPLEKFRGDPDHWVDAETFVKKGEEVMPLLKANNRRLEDSLEAVRRENAELKKSLSEINSNMGEFLETQKELLKDKLAAQRTRIMAEIREARDAGNDERVDQLEEALSENREQKKTLEAKKEEPKKANGAATPAEPPKPPELVEWESHNTWFGGSSAEDARRTALAMQFGREAAAKNLQGKPFFDYIDKELSSFFRTDPPPDKSEGGRPSGQGNPASGSGRSYKDLPPDAKSMADRDAARFVGPNKLFKTKEAWQAHFAEQYFLQE